MPNRRLALAFVASIMLHAAGPVAGVFKAPARPAVPLRLEASLRMPPPLSAEPLLKNTLEAEPLAAERPVQSPEPSPTLRKPPASRPLPRHQAEDRQMQAAQRKLAAHTFYPPEAIARGLEGDVRVILILAGDGEVADVQLAASSGHAMLDNAAIKAAFAMGRLPGVSVRQMILPVSFRLQ